MLCAAWGLPSYCVSDVGSRLSDCDRRSELNLGVQPAGFTVVKSFRPTDDHKDYLRVPASHSFVLK